MDERKFRSRLLPWEEKQEESNSEVSTGADNIYAILPTSRSTCSQHGSTEQDGGDTCCNDYFKDSSLANQGHKKSCNAPPLCTRTNQSIKTFSLLETLSHNPKNFELLYEVAKAELERLDGELTEAVARCAELEEEKARRRCEVTSSADNNGSVFQQQEEEISRLRLQLGQQAEDLKRFQDIEKDLKNERRMYLDLGIQYFDMKKEVERLSELIASQDFEINREERSSNSVEKCLELQRKQLLHARTRLTEQSKKLEAEQNAHSELRKEYEQQAGDLTDLRTTRAILNDELDAASTTIVELSSQLGGMERQRKVNLKRARHEEAGIICQEQAIEIGKLIALLRKKECELQKKSDDLQNVERRHQIDIFELEKEVTSLQAEVRGLRSVRLLSPAHHNLGNCPPKDFKTVRQDVPRYIE